MLKTCNTIVCPGCGCLCDDITLQLDGQQVVDFQPRCALGREWFASQTRVVDIPHRIQGTPASLDEAVARAAELLLAADYPLIYGLSRSSTPGQRAAVALGESLGGVVDTTASLCHGPSIMAIQEVGEVTSTLGEIKNRADLVIFWGCNPADSHPRHAERYSVTAPGRWIPQGRSDRRVVMIGSATQIESWQLDQAGTQPDLKIAIEPSRDFEVLRELTLLYQGRCPTEPDPRLQQLLEMIRTSRYGVFFFGLGLAETGAWGGTPRTGTGHLNVAALLHLVAELNSTTRFTARRMRLQGDVSGADNVLCWQTAYPFAVDFARGYPRYNPGEYSANELLERSDADAALIVGAETIPYFSEAAQNALRRIPTILLDYPGAGDNLKAEVSFTTAAYGIHAEGTAYRMDNVPISLKKILDSPLPTDEQVLTALLAHCQQSRG